MFEELFFPKCVLKVTRYMRFFNKSHVLFLEIILFSCLKMYNGFLSLTVNKHIIFISSFSNVLGDIHDLGFCLF